MAGLKPFEQSPPRVASDVAEHTKRSNTPALLVRRSSMGSKSPETISSAYVLDWEGGTCSQRLLNRAEDLLGESVGRRRLTIIQGLPLDLVQILRDSLGVNAGFLEAHAGRRQHRPTRRDNSDSFVSFEYPELVKIHHNALGPDLGYKPSARQSDLVDVMDEAPFHTLSGDGQSVIFCHASLWTSGKADILFLDRPIWHDPSSQLRKARRALSVARSWQTKIDESQLDGTSVWNVLIAEGDELPGLEDSLLRTFRHADVTRQALPDLLRDVVYSKWLDFFDTLPPSFGSTSMHDASLYWQAMESLEQNMEAAQDTGRHPTTGDMHHYDWHHLLSRLQRRVDISRLATSTASSHLLPSTRGLTTAQPRTRGTGMHDAMTRAQPDASTSWPDESEANQRALDRVTYLGGILLPFTVVSAILSMNDEYSPNAPRFWVFWVASIGAAILCLFIIYLDQLRCLEVYFEVAATDTVQAIFSPGKAQDYGSNRIALMSTPASMRRPARRKTELFVDMPRLAAGDMEVMADSAVNPTMIVEQCSDGSEPKAWQRGKLGWGGAMKKIVGYYWWRGRMPVQISSNGAERFRMKEI
ncbi:cysteine protease domain-containing protein [Colletotrichum musicola]|uniref:Cysteine protease domain-containing protein n=1 Tax=Colletotrichum musicola TaxID=2175873 RepID=A0A8H6KKB4_9PEZI|nr:cysteine protease domain-containing protein [Colletotrichum musicola]